MSEKTLNPLVSVRVITYNSAKTVLETLESIKAQTYPNIELIISDDCSTDNTVELCHEWLEKNSSRFVRTELITVLKNTGVTANIKRSEEACRGDWVKGIAGDDLLMPNCIMTYMDYVTTHPQAIFVFSRVCVFGVNQDIVARFKDTIFDYSFFDLTIDQQYEWMICRSIQPIPAATTFYNQKRTRELGIIWDERIPMLDDWPRWIQCLEKGVRFYFIDKELVKYRVSESSICSGSMYSDSFRKSLALMYIYYQYKPAQKYQGKIKAWIRYLACKRTISDKAIWRVLYVIIQMLLIPKRIVKII